ncbi:hypothetical protein [Nocardioides sp. W7]|uniref:hypothetical protein n=1 Tax=Nocardioides sp. W7 TaxID=2931390 RepID=UPI001FD1574A|nr:hypothetical protein [Nocardioides sp. W7]
MATVRYLNEFGPTVLAMQSLLRTAIWGGAQTVWLLAEDDRAKRLERATRVQYYSDDNYREWLNTYAADPAAVRARDKVIEKLGDLGKQAKVDQTTVVQKVPGLVFADQPEAVRESEQAWRELGSTAHALPWEIDTRVTSERTSLPAPSGHITRQVTARWAEIGSHLGFAYAFLSKGWGQVR